LPENILEVDDITVGYYEDIDILIDVSLNVKKNSVTVVIGPNGAGKSTLLKTIFRILTPKKGDIRYNGKSLLNVPPYELIKLGISYIPQGRSIFPFLTVEENLLMGGWIYRKNQSLLKERIKRVYEIFPELEERKNLRAALLSGGQARMLEFAKALITEPQLMLIDEPSAGISPVLVKQIYKVIRNLTEQDITILLVDQNILQAVNIADHVYLLELGRIKLDGPGDYFREHIKEIVQATLIGY